MKTPNINTPVWVFFLIFVPLLQLANSLENKIQNIMTQVFCTSRFEYSYGTNHIIKHVQRKHRTHHELCVSFGKSVSHKPNRLQMIDHSMDKLGLPTR